MERISEDRRPVRPRPGIRPRDEREEKMFDIKRKTIEWGGKTLTLETGRIARLIELDPKYCDLIRRRWHRYATEHGLDVGDGLP